MIPTLVIGLVLGVLVRARRPRVGAWRARTGGVRPRVSAAHGLFYDPCAHAAYLPLFLFGLGLARSPVLLDRALRVWRPLLGAALGAYAIRMA